MKKEQVLKHVLKNEDRLFAAKILDKAYRADKIHGMVYSNFLDPYQKNVMEKALSNSGYSNFGFTGGYPGAERQIIFFCPSHMSIEEYGEEKCPIQVLEITLKGRENLSHRDYLGAVMGLGIQREKIGDILVREDTCSMMVMEDIADYIRMNLAKVGNVTVDTELREIEEVDPPVPKVKEINATVASLRLDAVASAGYGMSRSKIIEWIKAEKVHVNWEIATSTSRPVKEGDTLSIRGKGRVVIEQVRGTTKKGRTGIILKKYV